MITKSIGTYVTVDVDIDMAEFDTEELIDELENRKIVVYDPHENDDLLDKMYIAYTQGQIDKLIEMMPEFFWRTVGRVA